VRKFFDDLLPTARGSPHNRKSEENNSPETKSKKSTGSVKCDGQKSLQFDDLGKTDQLFGEILDCMQCVLYNIDDLNTSKGAAVKVVISYPREEVLVTK